MTAGRTALALIAAGTVALAGCGVPTDDTVHGIDSGAIPSGLLQPAGPPSPHVDDVTSRHAVVYFTNSFDLLVGVPRALDPTSASALLQALMTQLTAGPEAAERSRGLATAIPPTTILTVANVTGGLATIDVAGEQLSSIDQTTVVAQVVLSATSLLEITSVRLTLGGQPLDAPLVDGALTSRPLTPADYDRLLAQPRG